MTRFAFALKCGCFGARGFAPAIAPETFCSAINDPSAIEPSPTPHCCKNQRRVISFACSTRNSCSKDKRDFMFVMLICRETTSQFHSEIVGILLFAPDTFLNVTRRGSRLYFAALADDPIVQRFRTLPFHGSNTGSNPVRVATPAWFFSRWC